MAHSDYDCCLLCDCKIRYMGYDAQPKEDLCVDCQKALRDDGIGALDKFEFLVWVEKQDDKDKLQETLTKLGYSPCVFNDNEVDEVIARKLK